MDATSACPVCRAPLRGDRCPSCGHTVPQQSYGSTYLPPGRMLCRHYRIERLLGAGGFGITYLALDTETGLYCAVKEYYPTMLAWRDPDTLRVLPSGPSNDAMFRHGLKAFVDEAHILSKFSGHPSIVQITDAFYENGTAYFVMEYLDGANLRALCQGTGGRLAYDYGVALLDTMARTLEDVHSRGLLHRDVSPENILVTRTGQVKLIDFGATRQFVGENTRSMSIVLKPGFAPPEQYSTKGNQGPWTDVYALCATFYSLFSDTLLPDAPERLGGMHPLPMAQAAPGLDAAVCSAIDVGLALDYRNRPKSMRALREKIRPAAETPPPAFMAPSDATQKQFSGAPAVRPIMRPYIQRICNGKLADRWDIPPDTPIRIGRSGSTSNVVVYGEGISRVHCIIQYVCRENVFALIDESVNGTLLPSGARCHRGRVYALRPGEVFFILSMDTPLVVGADMAKTADKQAGGLR